MAAELVVAATVLDAEPLSVSTGVAVAEADALIERAALAEMGDPDALREAKSDAERGALAEDDGVRADVDESLPPSEVLGSADGTGVAETVDATEADTVAVRVAKGGEGDAGPDSDGTAEGAELALCAPLAVEAALLSRELEGSGDVSAVAVGDSVGRGDTVDMDDDNGEGVRAPGVTVAPTDGVSSPVPRVDELLDCDGVSVSVATPGEALVVDVVRRDAV